MIILVNYLVEVNLVFVQVKYLDRIVVVEVLKQLLDVFDYKNMVLYLLMNYLDFVEEFH